MRAHLAIILAAAVVATAGSGCGRVEVLTSRLADMPDTARRPLSDCLWQSGSVYRFAAHYNLRCEITRTDHGPGEPTARREVWLVDLVGGRFRIDRPDLGQVVAFDGTLWRVFVQGRQTDDLDALADAGGDGMIARQILPLPFSLLDGGLALRFAGERVGPLEARRWIRLLVDYGGAPGYNPADRMLVEIDKAARRVDAAVITWQESPFFGGTWRVTLDEWLPVDGLLVAHRWRMGLANESGAAEGAVRRTYEVTAAQWDVPPPSGGYSGP
jgi:hypothetical protein